MLIIGNGRLVTRDAGQPFFENGAVAIDGTTIKKVGTLEEIKKEFPEAEFVDAKGGVIMPAFINTHEHIYSAMATTGSQLQERDMWGCPLRYCFHSIIR